MATGLMRRRIFVIFLSVNLLLGVLGSSGAQASITRRQFLSSVLYGTLAGALVGTATLAFTSDPGGNTQNIAKGASLGLYAGILLGLYVNYASDDGPKRSSQAPSLYEGGGSNGTGLSQTSIIPQIAVRPTIRLGHAPAVVSLWTIHL